MYQISLLYKTLFFLIYIDLMDLKLCFIADLNLHLHNVYKKSFFDRIKSATSS